MGRKLNQLDQFRLRDEHHPRNERYGAEEQFTGTLPERARTNFCNIVVFFVILLGVIPLCALAIPHSQFYRLTRNFDFRADHCGMNQLLNKTYFYMVDPVNQGTIGICVEQCPSQAGDQICFYDVDGYSLLDDYCYFTYTTYTQGFSCSPTTADMNYLQIYNAFFTQPEYLMRRAAGDIYLTFDLILLGFAILVFIGIVLLLLLMITALAKAVIFLCFLGFFVLGGYVSYLFYLDYKKFVNKMCLPNESINECAGTRGTLFFAFPYVLGCLLAILLVYFIVKIKRVLAAIKVIQETLKPLRNLYQLFFITIVAFIVQLAGAFGVVYLWVCMMACGTVETVTAPTNFPAPQVRTVMTGPWQFYCTIYLGFIVLWYMGICIHLVKYIVASSISTWYFSREKSILHRPIRIGLRNVFRFHLGTIVHGSMMVTLTWPLKRMMELIRARLEKSNIKSKSFRFCLVCWSCLLNFYEQRLKYVSSRNYTQTAIFGDDFWSSGEKVYYLHWRNQSRIFQIKRLLGFILVITKGFMIFVPVFVVYFWILNIKKSIYGVDLTSLTTTTDIEFPAIPPLVILIVGLYASQIFAGIPDLITDTLVFCFICDEEMFTGKQRFATPEMKKWMDSIGKEADRKNELEVRFYKKREEDELKPKEEEPIKLNDHSDIESKGDNMEQRLRPDSAASGHSESPQQLIQLPIVKPHDDSHDSDAEDDGDDAHSAIGSQKNDNKNLLAASNTKPVLPTIVNNSSVTKLPPLTQAQKPIAPMNNNLMKEPIKNESDDDDDDDEDEDEESKQLSPQKQPIEEPKKEEEENKDNQGEIQIVGTETKKSEQNFEDSEDEEDIDKNTKNNPLGNMKAAQSFKFEF